MADFNSWIIYALLCFVFPVAALTAAWFVRPKPVASKEKLLPYECGVDPKGPAWTRLQLNYFKYALVFLLFDIEILFLYPWAVEFRALGWFAFAEMTIFILILVIGLWYAWKEGALKWQ